MAGRFSLNGGAGSSLAEGGGSSPALVATESVPSRRANGRPTRARADEIKTAILQAALAEFAERGFYAGSIVGIAGRANVTRATVYNHFNSKEVLLDKLAEYFAGRLRASIEAVIDFERPVWVVLQDVARCWYKNGVGDDAKAISRILIVESDRFPELVAKSYELRWSCVEPLSNYLHALSLNGTLALDDAPRAALQFMHLVTRSVDFLFAESVMTRNEHERWISAAVRIFLHGSVRQA